MIVRLMGEGQYEVEDATCEQLNRLDDQATAAVEAGDGTALARALDEMFALVQGQGRRLADDDLSASDAIVPPSDLTLEETRELMTHEGLIPDLPSV